MVVVVVEWDSAPLFPWVGSIRMGDLRWVGQFSLPRGSRRVRTPGRPCTGMQEPNKVKLLVIIFASHFTFY